MALILADRVLETCTSPGTGNAALLGAVTGYQTFSAAVGNGNTCYYAIADQSGANWEVGIGTYNSTGNNLARTTVLASSNGGALANFASGTQNVFLTYPADKAVSTDTLAYPPAIGGTTPNTGSFTALTATGVITHNTTTNNQSYTTTGAGTITLTSGTAGSINNFNIGATTAGTGAFTTLSASSTVSGTGFSTYLASPPAIGNTAPNTGAFTTLSASSTVSGTGFTNYFASPPAIGSTAANTGAFTTLGATGAVTFNTTANNQSYTTTGAGTITISSGTAGSMNNIAIGATTPASGKFTNVEATGGLLADAAYGGAFTDGTVVDYATGTGRISVGASDNLTFYTGGIATTQVLQLKYQGQINFKPLAANPASATAGDLYYNSTSNKFQAYNGTSWSAVGGGVTISDTAPSTPSAGDLWWESDSGTMYVYYTDADSSQWVQAAGGGGTGSSINPTGGGSDQVFYENGQAVTTSYTLTTGKNAMTAGPITINAAATVTVPNGQNWVIL